MIKGLNINQADGLQFEDCHFIHFSYGYKLHIGRKVYSVCEIPTPHGDLIDRDDLLAYFERKSKGKTAEEALKLLYTALKAYPTVIEKEMN
jgi:hypothetical protein